MLIQLSKKSLISGTEAAPRFRVFRDDRIQTENAHLTSLDQESPRMTLLLDRPSQQALLELKRILIVDDEEPIRRLLGYMLQSHGYEAVLAADAREARLKLDDAPFALVLCDVNMPGESGMDLIRHTFR